MQFVVQNAEKHLFPLKKNNQVFYIYLGMYSELGSYRN